MPGIAGRFAERSRRAREASPPIAQKKLCLNSRRRRALSGRATDLGRDRCGFEAARRSLSRTIQTATEASTRARPFIGETGRVVMKARRRTSVLLGIDHHVVE